MVTRGFPRVVKYWFQKKRKRIRKFELEILPLFLASSAHVVMINYASINALITDDNA